MAEDKSKFIKLNKNVQSECKNIFAKDSELQVIVEPSKASPTFECIAINAKDEDGLPYPNDNDRLYTLALKKDDFVEVDPITKVAISIPYGGFGYWGEEDNSPLDLGLEDKYADKDYTIDNDGNIMVKTSKFEGGKKIGEVKDGKVVTANEAGENMLTDSGENISTAFENKVEGQDDPSYSEPWTADEKEMPATPPILGELTAKAKELEELVKKAYTEDNMLTESNKDITTDFSTEVAGSGQVEDVYKEDTKEMPWKDENLGKTNKQKTALDEQNLKGQANVVQNITDYESNLRNYGDTADDFDISAEELGLTPEQEAEALKGMENNIEDYNI